MTLSQNAGVPLPQSTYNITKKIVLATQAKVKTELDAVPDDAGDRARIHHAIKRAKELQDATSLEELLENYVFIMSALVAEERQNTLPLSKINTLVESGQKVLTLLGIKPGKSKLAHLHGDLHAIMSQIYRRKGLHWQSAWEQQMSQQMTGAITEGGNEAHQLGMANRILRLGNASHAMRLFKAAEAGDLTKRQQIIARFGQIKAARLGGLWDLADALIEENLRFEDVRFQRDLKWEQICLTATRSGDLSEMLRSTRKEKPHYAASFIIETYFWAWAVQGVTWRADLPQLISISRRKKLNPQSDPDWWKCARVIEFCYDKEYPFSYRLARVGENMAIAEDLITIDKELLFWVAISRWLANTKATDLAALCLAKYRSLSLSLSSGKNDDVLNLAQDLLGKPWAKEAFDRYQGASMGV